MSRYTLGKLALLGFAGLAIELTILDACSIKGARPEGLVVLACFAALFAEDSRQGLLGAWIAGLLKDAAGTGPLGLYALLFLAAGWVVLRVRQVLYRENPLTQISVAFLAGCGINLAAALFVSATAGAIPAGLLLSRTLLSAALTALLAPPFLFLLARARWLVR